MLPVVEKVVQIFSVSSRVTELEDRVEFVFDAGVYDESWHVLKPLFNGGYLAIFSDDDSIDDLDELTSLQSEDECRGRIEKGSVINFGIDEASGSENLLFFSQVGFESWLKSCPDPFNASHPFYRGDRLVIWLAFLQDPIVGERLSLLPVDYVGDSFEDIGGVSLPLDSDVRSVVNFVTTDSVKVEPVRFKLPFSSIGQACAKYIHKCYVELLCCSLSKEFYGRGDVIVSGVKRVSFRLSDADFLVHEELVSSLEKAVAWAYLAHSSTRLMLVMERLSLDLNPEHPILPNISENLEKSLQQAKHKYEYVIKDRQEEHAKEVSELQKDIKSATDAFSNQATGLMSGTLRDSLYSLVVIAIGLLTRVIDDSDVVLSSGFSIIFKALASYLVVSAVVRTAFGWASLKISAGDLYKWKDAVRNHLSRDEVDEHIQNLTTPYLILFVSCASIVLLIHVVLAIFVWNIPNVILLG